MALTKVQAEGINVADDFAFTGTVSGAVKAQVQTHLVTTSTQSISAGTRANITGLNAAITPSNSSKRIKVSVRWNGEYSHTNNYTCVYGIKRDSTDIGNPAAASDRIIGMAVLSQGYWNSDAASTPDSVVYSYIDSPATTSEITYHATIISSLAGTLNNQRTVGDGDDANNERITSTMTLEEID